MTLFHCVRRVQSVFVLQEMPGTYLNSKVAVFSILPNGTPIYILNNTVKLTQSTRLVCQAYDKTPRHQTKKGISILVTFTVRAKKLNWISNFLFCQTQDFV